MELLVQAVVAARQDGVVLWPEEEELGLAVSLGKSVQGNFGTYCSLTEPDEEPRPIALRPRLSRTHTHRFCRRSRQRSCWTTTRSKAV